MREFRLKYGESRIVLRLPEQNVLQFVEVPHAFLTGDNLEKLTVAFSQPVAAPPLSNFVRNRSVILLMEDATRDVPYEDNISVMAPHLVEARFVQVIISTGTHSSRSPGNQRIAATVRRIFLAKGVPDFDIIVHDGYRPPFIHCGRTKSGNEILVNPRMKRAEAFIVCSDMKNHYFAGYSNPLKNFLPGICAHRTVEANHALTLDDRSTFGRHPWHPDPDRRDNPLAAEILEGFRKIVGHRPVWALVNITRRKRIIWSRAGDPQKVTQLGIQEVDELMSRQVVPADVLVVSSGGFPNDESLYTAQRALELSKNAVKPGGKVLFLAECRNEIGPPSSIQNFYNLLTQDLEKVLKVIEQDYVLFAHKAYKFARMITRLSYLGLKSSLPAEVVKKIHISPVDDPQKLLERWIRNRPGLKINLVDDGNKIALYPGNGRSF